jgi:cholesterol transport system auxiliary component
MLFACLTVSGCGGLFQSRAKPEQTYYLRVPAKSGAPATSEGTQPTAVPTPSRGLSLRVGHPMSAPGLDTTHILLVQADRRMNFYTGSRWPAPIPDVVEALAADTLRGSGAWTSVQDSGSPFPTDYLLAMTVRRFEADYSEGDIPVAKVVFDCTVGRREGRDVLATFTASGSAPAAANRLTAVVAAFEQAATTALATVAQNSLQAAREDAQRAAQNAENPVPSITR